MRASTLRLTLDSAAPARRWYDLDGRLRIHSVNLSKANISPYRGSEIPGWKGLGLQPTGIYHLLRPENELRKAAEFFRNLPLMRDHVEVTAKSHAQDAGLVCGAVGSDVHYTDPYLRASVAVWSQPDIDGIESEEKSELSAAYHYVPRMTPGTHDGQHFDGVMT